MFDWLKRCFGEGKIRVEGVDTTGRAFTAKVPYIGDISTLSKPELLASLNRNMRVEFGVGIDFDKTKIVAIS